MEARSRRQKLSGLMSESCKAGRSADPATPNDWVRWPATLKDSQALLFAGREKRVIPVSDR